LNNSTLFTAIEKRAIFSLATLYGFRMLGLFMVLPVLALYVDDYSGATPLLLGVTLGIYGLTQALLQIPLGLLSDQIGRSQCGYYKRVDYRSGGAGRGGHCQYSYGTGQ
jgi:MFS family permease